MNEAQSALSCPSNRLRCSSRNRAAPGRESQTRVASAIRDQLPELLPLLLYTLDEIAKAHDALGQGPRASALREAARSIRPASG